MDLKLITKQVSDAVEGLFNVAPVKPGQILVVGCSTSEVCGGKIGKNSSLEVGEAVTCGLLDSISKYSVNLAAQCCEHLNRALVVEEETAIKYGLEIVSVIPVPHAGGSFATSVRKAMKNPVIVEHIKAHWGLDIGDTMIGMHMKHVAVPVRLEIDKIGHAHLTAARYRPKLIGGSRAQYVDFDDKK